MAVAVAERGAGADGPTVAEAAARAGVGSEVSGELFEDREACLLAAFELGIERAGTEMIAAYQAESRWLDGVKSALAHLLWFLEEEPALGRLLIVHSTGAGPALLRRRMEVLAVLARAVDRGRGEVGGAHELPPVVAEGVVGAVLAVVQSRLLTDERQPPMELFGSLVSIVVLPYMGAGVARRELTRPAPRRRTRDEMEHGPAAFAGQLGTRLTYRTARVLSAIEDYPGASNREVAERAGIVDQGQISKLLARLQARGLVEKTGEGRTRGAPNSWRLTEQGGVLMRTEGLRAAARSRIVPPS